LGCQQVLSQPLAVQGGHDLREGGVGEPKVVVNLSDGVVSSDLVGSGCILVKDLLEELVGGLALEDSNEKALLIPFVIEHRSPIDKKAQVTAHIHQASKLVDVGLDDILHILGLVGVISSIGHEGHGPPVIICRWEDGEFELGIDLGFFGGLGTGAHHQGLLQEVIQIIIASEALLLENTGVHLHRAAGGLASGAALGGGRLVSRSEWYRSR